MIILTKTEISSKDPLKNDDDGDDEEDIDDNDTNYSDSKSIKIFRSGTE